MTLEEGGSSLAFHGPSHVVRMAHAVKTGQVPAPPGAQFFGGGGVPVWTPRTLAYGREAGRRNRLVVGDFRFGNRVAGLADPFAPGAPRNFALIAPELISPENDRLVYGLALQALDEMAAVEQADLRMLFWDLLIRESRNRIAGNYVIDGRYQHPIWNLEELTERYAAFTPDLKELVGDPLSETLAIDPNCHPSLKGWSFIFNCLSGLDGREILERIHAFDAALRQDLHTSAPEAVLIGDSQVVPRLHRLLRTGAVVFPKGWTVEPKMSPDEALASGRLVVDFHPLAFSPSKGPAWFGKRVEDLAARIDTYSANSNYRVVLWDMFGWGVIGERSSRFADLTPADPEFHALALEARFGGVMAPLAGVPSSLGDAMIELNRNMEPTQLGVLALAALITHGRLGAADVDRYHRLIKPFFPHSAS